MSKLSGWLRPLIKRRNLTGNALADRSGIPNSVIWRWLNDDDYEPDFSTVCKLATYFHWDVVSLMEEIGMIAPQPDLAHLRASLRNIIRAIPSGDDRAQALAEHLLETVLQDRLKDDAGSSPQTEP